MSQQGQGDGEQVFKYDPSLPAAAIFAATFGISALLHVFQLIRWKTWYFIPFTAGSIFLSVGHIIRIVSIEQKPNYEKMPYVMQMIFILLAPALFAASIYMVLGRIILLLDAEKYALIRRRWLTKIFVAGDVISIVVQGVGAPMMTSAKSKSDEATGKAVIVTGLFVQIIVFGLFIVVTIIFHRRFAANPTITGLTTTAPWRRYIFILYGVSMLVMGRSIFRVAEFIQGSNGELMTKEVYFYVLDVMLMFFVSVIFNIFHPRTIIVQAPKYTMPLESLDEPTDQEMRQEA